MDNAEWSIRAAEAKEMCVSCKSFILKTLETMKYLEGYQILCSEWDKSWLDLFISPCSLGGRGRNRGDGYIKSSGLGGWFDVAGTRKTQVDCKFQSCSTGIVMVPHSQYGYRLYRLQNRIQGKNLHFSFRQVELNLLIDIWEVHLLSV